MHKPCISHTQARSGSCAGGERCRPSSAVAGAGRLKIPSLFQPDVLGVPKKKQESYIYIYIYQENQRYHNISPKKMGDISIWVFKMYHRSSIFEASSSQNFQPCSATKIKVETEMATVTGRRLEQPRLKDGLGPQSSMGKIWLGMKQCGEKCGLNMAIIL